MKKLFFVILFSIIFGGVFTWWAFSLGKCEPNKIQILVSDRLKQCEQKGGHYSLLYYSYPGKYMEKCELADTDIQLQ